MGVFSREEVDARQEVMYENYNTTLEIEVETLIKMVEAGILPACAKDLANYTAAPELGGDRKTVYGAVKSENDKLKDLMAKAPHDMVKMSEYLCNTVMPQMSAVRKQVDTAEGLMQ